MVSIFRHGEPLGRLQGSHVREAQPLPEGDILVTTDSGLSRVNGQGQVEWSVSGNFYEDTVAVGQNALYAATAGVVRRLDPESGATLWTQPIRQDRWPTLTSLALGPAGSVYAATPRGRADRLNPETGAPEASFHAARTWVGRWLSTFPVSVHSAPDGTVLVLEAFKAVCREPEGKHRWSHKFSECVDSPVHCRERWLFSDNHGALTAIHPGTGRLLWQTGSFVPNGGNHGVPSVTPGPPGIVYFHPRATALMALDEQTGQVLARYGKPFPNPDMNFDGYRPTLGQDGRLYVSRSGSEELAVLDPLTLAPLDRIAAPGANPVLAPSADWIISRDGPGLLRIDPLFPPTVQELPAVVSEVEERGPRVIVGGVSIPRRQGELR